MAIQRHHVAVMGTVFSFLLAETVHTDVLEAADDELRRLDRVFSRWRTDSDVSRLNRGEVPLRGCAPDVTDVLALCADVEAWTQGYFSARSRGGIDPTGLVKGWAVARMSRLLGEAGSSAHVVSGGGDVLVVGSPPHRWRIGVVDPRRPGALLATLAASSLAVATSGNAERPGEIVDPFTGIPALDVWAVTVACDDIVCADAAATAAVARGEECLDWLEATPGLEALVVAADGGVRLTSRFAELICSPGRAGQVRESSADCRDWR